MSGLDIVLLKPGSQKRLYGELSDFQLTGIEPPVWGALLAAYLREQGYAVRLVDAEVESESHAETAEAILRDEPALTACVVSGTNPSASTMNMTGAGAVLREIKARAPEHPTLLMGLHPSALPAETLLSEEADYVCQGEGFLTLPPLLDALKKGKAPEAIPGLWRKEAGAAIEPEPAELVEDLGALPMPAWDLLSLDRYRAHNWHCLGHLHERTPYAVIYTSLGCPYRCEFCCTNALFGRRGIRYRDPGRVAEEIDWLVSRGVRNIKILDEMFALDPEHVKTLCALLAGRDYGLNMWAYARVDTVTPELLRSMKSAGIHWVSYGFESGDPEVLRSVSKGYSSKKVMDVVRMTADAGMYICANYIFGLPEDDPDSMRRTLDMALEINAEWANMYCTMAFPGSPLYRRAKKEGWPLPETWAGYSQLGYESLPLPTRTLSPGEVLAFRDNAFETYCTHPPYLAKVSRLFGEEAARHIQEMVRHKLKRKHIVEAEN